MFKDYFTRRVTAPMYGIKAVSPDITDKNGNPFIIGNTYTEKKCKLGECGFHFVENIEAIKNCHSYDFCGKRFYKIKATGKILTRRKCLIGSVDSKLKFFVEDNTYVTTQITFLEEIFIN